MSNFSEKLKDERIKNKLTQKTLSEMLNISDRTISKWETGKGYPDITMLNSIAECLNTTVSELMESKDIKQTNVTKRNLENDSYRNKYRKLFIISVSLLLTAFLFIILPILKFSIPDGAIGAIEENSDLYNVLAIILTIFISLSYIISGSTFVYMMFQYSNQIKVKFHNFSDRNIYKKYGFIYIVTLLLMIVFVVVIAIIEI